MEPQRFLEVRGAPAESSQHRPRFLEAYRGLLSLYSGDVFFFFALETSPSRNVFCICLLLFAISFRPPCGLVFFLSSLKVPFLFKVFFWWGSSNLPKLSLLNGGYLHLLGGFAVRNSFFHPTDNISFLPVLFFLLSFERRLYAEAGQNPVW